MSEISSSLSPAPVQPDVPQPAQPKTVGAPKVPDDAKGAPVVRAEHLLRKEPSSAASAELAPKAPRAKVWSDDEIEKAIRTPGEAEKIPGKGNYWTVRRAEIALRDDGNVYRVLPLDLRLHPRLIEIALNSRPVSGENCLTGPLAAVPQGRTITKDMCLAALGAGHARTFEAIPEKLKHDPDIQLAACLRHFSSVVVHIDEGERTEDLWVASVRSLLRMGMESDMINQIWVQEHVPEELRGTCLQKAQSQEKSGVPCRFATPGCRDPYDPTQPGTLIVERLIPPERQGQDKADLRTVSYNPATDMVVFSAREKVFKLPKDPPVDGSGRYLYTRPRNELRAVDPAAPMPLSDQKRHADRVDPAP